MLQGKATFSPNILRAGKKTNWNSNHRSISVSKVPTRVRCKSSLSRVDNPRNLPYTELKDGSLLFRFGDPQQAAFDELDAPGSSRKQQPGTPVDCDAVNSQKPSVHFIGIGGAGLSALAHVALEQGWGVSGSDVSDSAVTQALRNAGAVVNIGHSADKLGTGTLSAVVVSSAISEDNPEVEAAASKGVSIFKRGEWLAQVTSGTDLVAVAGTHGKTTTSAMLSVLLRETFFDDITAVIGAPVPQFPEGVGAVVGSSGRFVLEADEYDDAFGQLDPLLAIVTNVELDHVDMYMSDAEIRGAFAKFVGRVREGGALLVCGDDAGARSLITHFGTDNEALALDRSVITYGLEQGNHWSAIMLTPNMEGGTDFVVVRAGQPVGRVTLRVPGVHNVLNTLAVIAAAATLRAAVQSAGPMGPLRLTGLNDQAVVAAAMRAVAEVHTFEGVNRRFQELGQTGRCVVYDDYAHHPTEVRATLQAARQRFDSAAIWVAFQPHTVSRLEWFLEDFGTAFSGADKVIVTEVFKARTEKGIEGDTMTGETLAEAIMSPPALYIPSLSDAAERLARDVKMEYMMGDERQVVIIVMGAGDSNTLGPELLQKLE